MLDRDTYNDVVDFLIPYFDDNTRRTWLEGAFHGSRLLQWVNYTGSSRDFASEVVVAALKFGEIEAGTPALVHLLRHMRGELGIDRQAQIDTLIARIEKHRNGEQACAASPYLQHVTVYLASAYQFDFTWVRLNDDHNHYFLAKGAVGWLQWHVVIIFAEPHRINLAQITTFSQQCHQHVKDNKTKYGIANNVIVVPVLLGCDFPIKAVPFEKMVPQIGLYGVQLPAVCDLSRLKLHLSPKTPPLGIVYIPTVRDEIRKILTSGFNSHVK